MPDTNEFERIGKIDRFAENGERSTEGLPITKGFPQRQKPKRVWFNALFYDITRKINELIDAVNRLTNQDDPVFQAYTVGDIYTTTLDFKTPEEVATAKGYGTWKRYAEGRTLVGYTTNLDDRAEYAVMGNEFGEDEHILTIEEMPSHKHSTGAFNKFSSKASDTGKETMGSGDLEHQALEYGTGKMTEPDWTTATEKSQGGNAPHNNTQPSVVVAHWLRVA